ncbi:MAG TPA: hypothetical protein VMW57_07080 [Methyloceanibacter sp.]|nr:hypothetical protein [Methyloceanibacter sp.]
MTKIPVKTRLPIEAWTVAVLVTLFSLLSSVAHISAPNAATQPMTQATLDSGAPLTSLIR